MGASSENPPGTDENELAPDKPGRFFLLEYCPMSQLFGATFQ